MNTIQQNREIGELIMEIIDSGFSDLQIDIDDSGLEYRRVSIIVNCKDNITQMNASGHDLVETLRELVDDIREYIGKPSLSEEVENLLEENRQHETLPPIFTGLDAACRCGSRAPLLLERKLKCEVSWVDGLLIESDTFFPPQPGEILTCQDCGRNYSVGERQN